MLAMGALKLNCDVQRNVAVGKLATQQECVQPLRRLMQERPAVAPVQVWL